jgi:hypothetical protein
LRPSEPAASGHVSLVGLRLAARTLGLRYWLAAFGVIAWLVDLRNQLVDIPLDLMADGLSYAAGGRHLLAGEAIYAPFQLAGPYGLGAAALGQGFVYPPTAALLFVPLAPLDTAGLLVVFGAAWALFGLLTYRLGVRSGLGPKWAAALAVVVAFSGPAINGAVSGNANLILADALLASWLWPGSAGVLAVLGGAIKIFPVAGLIWTLRKGRSLVLPVALGVGIIVAATIVVGIPGWRDFITTFEHGRTSSGYFLSSPAEALGPLIGPIAGYGLALAAALGAWRVRNEAVAFALLGWAMILPAPDWYSHYLVVPLASMLPWIVGKLVLAAPIRGQWSGLSRARLSRRRPNSAEIENSPTA